jgi:hypothetical protein
MDAAIRFFCLVLPSEGPQAGFDYLEALEATELGVRAAPIGPAFLMSGRWPELQHLFFIGQVAKSYINVVCSPPNLLLGHTLRAVDVAPSQDERSRPDTSRAAPPVFAEGTSVDPLEPVYQAQTALAGLYTIGVPNIAITMPRPKPPDDHEIAALMKYDAVLSPSDRDADALGMLGVPAMHLPPETEKLKKFFSLLLP